MQVLQGHSLRADAAEAVTEATQDWGLEDPSALNLILAFCSTEQDAQTVAEVLAERFPDVPVAGCTTSGEHLSGRHLNGSLVLTAIVSPGVRWATRREDDLATLDQGRAMVATDALMADLGLDRDSIDPSKTFCLMFVDGLAMREETIASVIADCTEGMPLIGGSAGDDLAFVETKVIGGGEAKSDAVVLVMGHAEQPFAVVKHQHFTTTPQTLVITDADPSKRRVFEISGYPAAVAYAQALGVPREELTGELTFQHPVTFMCNDEIYVRSIQQVHDDDSITFYCAIEEGMVLDIAGHRDMVAAIEQDLAPLVERGRAELLIGCNCILRALEAGQKDQHDAIGTAWSKAAKHSIGFDTYGEQLNGLHINQTLVALAFFEEAA